MTKLAFDNFINQQINKKQENAAVDWNSKIKNWLSRIDDFYAQVENFLCEYTESKKIQIQYRKENIQEDYIGSYEAKVLIIEIGNQKLKFTPVGMLIVGSQGRIDLEGKNGKVKFVLVHKDEKSPNIRVLEFNKDTHLQKEQKENIDFQEDLAWKISTPPPDVQRIELTQETFLDALMEIADA